MGMEILQDKGVKQQPSISMVAAITLACNTSKDLAGKKLTLNEFREFISYRSSDILGLPSELIW